MFGESEQTNEAAGSAAEARAASGDGPSAALAPLAEPAEPALGAPARKPSVGLYSRFAGWVLSHQGSPYNLAMGFAVGIFVALTPTVGVQMIIAASIAHFLKANRVIAAALAWVTNPLTIVPIYYFNYRVGLLLLPGDEAAGLRFIHLIKSASILEPGSVSESLALMMREFGGIAGVLWLGSGIVALFCALLSYPIIYRIVQAEQAKLAVLRSRLEQRGH